MRFSSLAALACLSVAAAGCASLETQGGPALPELTGVYRATLPCEDCRGSDTALTLVRDHSGASGGSYNIWEHHVGRGEPPTLTAGRWETGRGAGEHAGETVYRLSAGEAEDSRSFLLLGSGSLQLIDDRERSSDPYLHYALVLRGVGLPDRAALHCIHHGGTAETRPDGEDSTVAVCVLSDERQCDAWPLYREGKCVREE